MENTSSCLGKSATPWLTLHIDVGGFPLSFDPSHELGLKVECCI